MDRAPTREEMNSLLRECVTNIQSTEKQLADLVIPPSLYELARSFVEITEFERRYHNPQVFILLLEASIEIHVLDEGEAELRKWREGLKALLRYPLNLLVAPNRPELKRIKVRMHLAVERRNEYTYMYVYFIIMLAQVFTNKGEEMRTLHCVC